MRGIRFSLLLSLFVSASPLIGLAQPGPAAQSGVGDMPALPSNGATRCVQAAASYHSVNPYILKAILKVESGFRPNALNRNNNGSVDVGMAQINSIHFPELSRHGIAPSDLMDACVATYVAAWHLAKQYKAHGNTWFAVGAYHSATPCFNRRYAGLVWNTLLQWGLVAGQRLKVQSLADCGYRTPTGSTKTPQKTTQPQNTESTAPMVAFDLSR